MITTPLNRTTTSSQQNDPTASDALECLQKSDNHFQKMEYYKSHLAAEKGLCAQGFIDPNTRARLYLCNAAALINLERFEAALKAAKEGLCVQGLNDPTIQAELFEHQISAHMNLNNYSKVYRHQFLQHKIALNFS
ncbi:MAG: hypothetical protein KR126chlam3_01363 [Chlamydiae bacterium]|nr:hypothetical protein [Chlamydiota bacterium]